MVDFKENLEITGRAVSDTAGGTTVGAKREATGDLGPRNPSTSPSDSAGSARDFTGGPNREVKGDPEARNPSNSSLCDITGPSLTT